MTRAKYFRIWAVTMMGVISTGCGSTAMLEADADHYTAGSSAVVTLTNTTLAPLKYNLCFATLERPGRDSWESVQTALESDGVVTACTAELRELPPGSSASTTKSIPADGAPGMYRFSVRVETPLGTSESLHTDAFTVE